MTDMLDRIKQMAEGFAPELEPVIRAVAIQVAQDCANLCKQRNMGDCTREDQEAMRCHDSIRARYGIAEE